MVVLYCTQLTWFPPLTQHLSLFCSVLANGVVMITGGTNLKKVSFFDRVTGSWTAGTELNIARGYHSNAVLGDGSVLVLGGSWTPERSGEIGEYMLLR